MIDISPLARFIDEARGPLQFVASRVSGEQLRCHFFRKSPFSKYMGQAAVDVATAAAIERHGAVEMLGVPRDFDGLRDYLRRVDVEGIVWHHPDGRMVKIKTIDFGLKRGE